MQTFDFDLWKTGEYDVVTRNGNSIKQLTYFPDVTKNCLIGSIGYILIGWKINGKFHNSGNPSEHDLMLVKKKADDFEPGDIVVINSEDIEVLVTDDEPKDSNSFSGTMMKSTFEYYRGHHSNSWDISSFKKKP